MAYWPTGVADCARGFGLNIGSVLDGQIKFHYFVFLQS